MIYKNKYSNNLIFAFPELFGEIIPVSPPARRNKIGMFIQNCNTLKNSVGQLK
jgi:hypothetical protein